MMPDNIDQNLRRGADSMPLFHCFIDQRLSFSVHLLRLFDGRLRSNEKIDQRFARRERFLNLPKLCVAETGSVTMRSKSQCFNIVYLASGFTHALNDLLHAAERERLGVLVFKLAKDHWYPVASARTSSMSA
jgi:hypothetical protein